MRDVISTWAEYWRVPPQVVDDLRNRLAIDANHVNSDSGAIGSEARAQSEIRLAGPDHGVLLWRNNKGALPNNHGIPVRFGLCNDNKQVGDTYSSADLIGIRRFVVQPQHVGTTIGQFASVEVKAACGRRVAPGQHNWANLVTTWGGWAKIANTPRVFVL